MKDLRQSWLYLPLLEQRRKMTPKQRGLTRNAISKKAWLYPFSVERSYKKAMNQYIDVLYKGMFEYVESRYEGWVSEFKTDSASDEIAELTLFIQNYQQQLFGNVDKVITDFLLLKSQEVGIYNVDQWAKFVGQTMGVKAEVAKVILPSEPWTAEVQKLWVTTNEALWTGVTTYFVNEVARVVGEGVQRGALWTEVTKDLLKVLPKKKGQPDYNRAKLIARDQIGKINSLYSQKRMEQAGITWYQWFTALDERVRGLPSGKYPKAIPRHDIMHGTINDHAKPYMISRDLGKTWKAKSGTEETLPAGWAIQCRCTQIPFFIELLELVDADLDSIYDY